MTILLDSNYWLSEIKKTKLELAELINGDLFSVKTAKTNEDTTTFHDLEQMIKAKKDYIKYCESEYEKEISKEKKTKKITSIIYFDREFGY